MLLYNTMSRQKERFEPIGNPVRLYVCGVTPYDTTHIGHARTYVFFDVLQRYLEFLGMPVRYVQNVTDVDDPLFERADQLGVDYRELAEKYTGIFLDDLRALNVRMPTVYPRASDEIPGMIETTTGLLEQGVAYERGGSVYFRAGSFSRFGGMSRLDRAGMLAAYREMGEDPQDPQKEDALDFRLWKASAPGEPAWESPWAPGRPGWHIECSTMATRHLGPRLDIHGGGADLIFPHHCCEIAQSETATGEEPFARFWVHVGLVAMEGDKMSKSKGNMAFVRDLIPLYGGDALRYYLLRVPYRQPCEYLERDLVAAAGAWRSIADACRDEVVGAQFIAPTARGVINRAPTKLARLRARCLAALDDDLDMPRALVAIREMADVARDGAPADRAALRSLLRLLGFRVA